MVDVGVTQVGPRGAQDQAGLACRRRPLREREPLGQASWLVSGMSLSLAGVDIRRREVRLRFGRVVSEGEKRQRLPLSKRRPSLELSA
jgi:hypothetical protein